MKFKVGDKVKVRSDLEAGVTYGCDNAISDMVAYAGKILTIKKVLDHAYRVEEIGYWWTDEMFEDKMFDPQIYAYNTFKRNPYKHNMAEAYVAAINILAVEYLIKTDNYEEYSRRCDQVNSLSENDLEILYIHLSLNMHTSTLGAMITQGDYEEQRRNLFGFLDESYPSNLD